MEILTKESISKLKSKVCDIVGELAGLVLKPEDWPEVLPLSASLVQVCYPIMVCMIQCLHNVAAWTVS